MIKDEETGWVEATIVINGRTCNFAEAMSIRVAVSTFRIHCNEPGTRSLLGPVADGYDVHLQLVEKKLMTPPADNATPKTVTP
jgi:hypothetical protein